MSTRTRAAVHDALPSLLPAAFPGFGEDAPQEIPALSPAVEKQVAGLLTSPEFDAWSEAVSRVGNCARPIRLRGRSETIDMITGEVLSSYCSEQEPLGVTHVRCGNRRATECPSCSRVFASDMFQLIRAGVAGGKTVPTAVAENPLVFATVTAPSFGPVHGLRDGGRQCRLHTRGPARCQHGRPQTCHRVHDEGDIVVGQPLCQDCYDYESHLVWQWWAPDLWRRFTIKLRRLIAKAVGVSSRRLPTVATIQYAKVAEYQRRGVVHFHALVRLDGPRTPEGFAAASPQVDAAALARLIAQAAASVRLAVHGVDADDPPRVLAFGAQLDARAVRSSRRTDDPTQVLRPDQVAGYLAKYATKTVEDLGTSDTPHLRRIRATARNHAERAIVAAQTTGDTSYVLLAKWVHMLGFRGHFASKSRRYSVTLGALRRARRRAQVLIVRSRESGRPLDLASLETDLLAEEETETTLVVGGWHYVGAGWANEAQTVLAKAAAARAREHDRWRADQRRKSTTVTGEGNG